MVAKLGMASWGRMSYTTCGLDTGLRRTIAMKKGPNETDVLVGARVRIRRVELGLSQTELANALGVTFQQVQKYEKGTNRIGASRLHAMSGVLPASVSYFFPAAADGADHSARPIEVL